MVWISVKVVDNETGVDCVVHIVEKSGEKSTPLAPSPRDKPAVGCDIQQRPALGRGRDRVVKHHASEKGPEPTNEASQDSVSSGGQGHRVPRSAGRLGARGGVEGAAGDVRDHQGARSRWCTASVDPERTPSGGVQPGSSSDPPASWAAGSGAARTGHRRSRPSSPDGGLVQRVTEDREGLCDPGGLMFRR